MCSYSFFSFIWINIQIYHLGRFRILKFRFHWFFFLLLFQSIFCICISLCNGIRFVVFTIFAVIGDFEVHLTCNIADRVERLSDHGDGFCRQVGEESDGSKEQNRCKTRCTHYVFQVLYDKDSMLSSRIEDKSTRKWRQKFGECDGTPFHDDHGAEKPFPQIDFVGMHELQSPYYKKGGEQE